MRKPKIYLAGKMSGLTFEEMNTWRLKAKELFEEYELDVHLENPCDYYNFELDPDTYTEKEVKKFDLWLVKNCDIVLVDLVHPNSIGTAIEIHEAHDNWKIPVISFGNAVAHPWMNLSIDKRCNTLEDAVEHIIDFYLPNIV
jgi:nucleoside 2-deoxyribosyltransferase